jgi:hypothetical protein
MDLGGTGAVILYRPARVKLAALESFVESAEPEQGAKQRAQALIIAIQTGRLANVILDGTTDEKWTLAAALDQFRPDHPETSMWADSAKFALSKELDYAPRYDSPSDVAIWEAWDRSDSASDEDDEG